MKGTIDGIEVYLDEGQLPAFTLSVNSLTDPSKVQGVRSTTIRIVATPEARRVLGTEYMARINPTARPVLRIGDGDVDLFRAEVVPVKWTRDVIECLAVGGNASWFAHAKQVKLDKMDCGMSMSPFVPSDTWTDADSLLYMGLVDFGALDGQPSSYNVSRFMLRAGFRVRHLIDKAFEGSKWSVVPRGRFADVYAALVVMAPANDPLTAIMYKGATGKRAGLPGISAVTINELGSSPSAAPYEFTGWDPPGTTTYSYTVPEDGTMRVRAELVRVSFDPFDPPTAGTRIYLHLFDSTTGTVLDSTYAVYDAVNAEVLFNHTFPEVPVTSGQEIKVAFQCEVGAYLGSSQSVTPGQVMSFAMNDALVEHQYIPWTANDFTYWSIPAGSAIQLTGLAPAMTLSDLLLAICADQCLVIDTDEHTGEVSLWYFDEYMVKFPHPGGSRDWTGRMAHGTAPERSADERMSAVRFRMKDDDGDDLLKRRNAGMLGLGFGNVDAIGNGVGQPMDVELPFAASIDDTTLGGLTIPALREFGGAAGVNYYGREPRLFVDGGMVAGTWKYDGANRTDYPRLYFTLPSNDGTPIHFGNADAGYEGTVATRWRDRLAILLRSDTLTAYFHLRDNELQDFDFGMPTLVDDGSGPAWYWVQEIKDHRFGAGLPTKVTLVKIPGMEYQPPANLPVEFPEPPQPPASPCTQPTSLHIVVPPGESVDYFAIDVSDAFDGYFMIEGDPNVHAVGDGGVPLSSGEYCLYTTDASGVPNGAATSIYLYANSLTALDASAWTAATSIYLYANSLTALDASAWTAATYIDLSANGLTTLDASAWTAATSINLYANSLTALDVSAWTAATYIYLYASGLTTLDASAWTAATTIVLYADSLTTLDASAWTAATTIVLYADSLTALDASAWTAATSIYLYANSLTTLDVPSVLAAVTYVAANNCPLDQASVDAILAAAVANPAITSAVFNLGGSCAAPSAAGYADKATLQSRGCTVNTN